MEDYIKGHIIEIHYGSRLLSSQERKYTKEFPIKDLNAKGIIGDMGIFKHGKFVHTDYLNLKLHGLNMRIGGSGSVSRRHSVPLYDIAVMVALGFSAPKIALRLKGEYGLYENVELATITHVVQSAIHDIMGGTFQAQEGLLKPIIEYLVDKGIARSDIYLAFKHAEFNFGWFNDWSYSKALIDADIEWICTNFNLDPKSSWEVIELYLDKAPRYYAGISEDLWLECAFKGLYKTGDQAEVLGVDPSRIGSRKVPKVLKAILLEKYKIDSSHIRQGAWTELRYQTHKDFAINALRNGFVEIDGKRVILTPQNFHTALCRFVYNFYTSNPKVYFETILFGMSLSDIWQRYGTLNSFNPLPL